MASFEPTSDAGLLVPLKAPSFYGTLEEYLSNSIVSIHIHACSLYASSVYPDVCIIQADHMRHARVGLSPMAPLGSSPVVDGRVPPSVKPLAIARSRQKPTIPSDGSAQAGKVVKVVQVRIALSISSLGARH